jgi:hypothetical protein
MFNHFARHTTVAALEATARMPLDPLAAFGVNIFAGTDGRPERAARPVRLGDCFNMELIEAQRLSATVKFDLGELLVLNNALNELCHNIEHETCLERVGTEAQTLRNLLDEINAVAVRVASAT